MKQKKNYFAAIDLGAGTGAKIGIFDENLKQQAYYELSNKKYEPTFDSLTENLTQSVLDLIEAHDFKGKIKSMGISTNGVLRTDGSYIIAANTAYLNGTNIAKTLEEKLQILTTIENDANAGGLAEWSVVQSELLYWALGGGFGGAWISHDGEVKFPAVDWDRQDKSLHFTNEPGYAVPLEKKKLIRVFEKYGFDYLRLEAKLSSLGVNVTGPNVTGPLDDKNAIRTELLVSGTGLALLFYSSKTYGGDLDLGIEEEKQVVRSCRSYWNNRVKIDGKYIYKLAVSRDTIALNTFYLFGEIFADAAHAILSAAKADQAKQNIPIFLAGGMLDALPFYGPVLQKRLTEMGHFNYVRPSNLAERGINPNLLGAAVLAQRYQD